MSTSVLFVGASDALDARCVAALRARGFGVALASDVRPETAAGYAVISFKRAGDVRPEVLAAAASSLKGIALRSRDLRALPPSFSERGVSVRVLEGLPEPVADFTLAAVLALWRLPTLALPAAASRCPPPRALTSATLGVVGMGRIGRLVATRAARLGLRVYGWDRLPAGLAEVADVSLEDLLSRSTILSLHLPLAPDTRHRIGAAELAQLPRGAVLVNTARAGVLDEAAVLEALERGHLAAAALDVAPWDDEWGATDAEVRTGRQLRTHPLVWATPHLAYATAESEAMLADQFADGVQGLLEEAGQSA